MLLAVLFSTNVYRAATQSIAHDEGVIFEWLLSGSWSQVLTVEHGNHHVLSDLACKLMLNLFGVSAFAYRIPALLGGLLYFYAVFGISALLFGEGFLFFLSVAFLSLNPFVLDYLCCARGYGPALGFFMYALYYVARFLAEQGTSALNRAGVGLGLSVGSNIIMIFPGLALGLSLIGLLLGSPAPANEEGRKKARKRAVVERPAWQQALIHFALPAIAIGGFLSILPNRLVELEAGYMGPPSLVAILEGLVRPSLFHSPWGFGGLLGWLPPDAVVRAVTLAVVPALLVVLIFVGVRIGVRAKGVPDRTLVLVAAMLPLNIVLIVASRYLFEQPYPELRTAVYWIPLLSLIALLLAARLDRRLFVPAAAVLLLGVVQYATQFNTRYFAEWQYCAAGKDMMEMVRADHAAGTRVRLGVTWQLEPVVNFYRVAWRLDWMDPVYRESPNNDAFDYYLLAYSDVGLVDNLHLKTLLKDPLSGTVLARHTN